MNPASIILFVGRSEIIDFFVKRRFTVITKPNVMSALYSIRQLILDGLTPDVIMIDLDMHGQPVQKLILEVLPRWPIRIPVIFMVNGTLTESHQALLEDYGSYIVTNIGTADKPLLDLEALGRVYETARLHSLAA